MAAIFSDEKDRTYGFPDVCHIPYSLNIIIPIPYPNVSGEKTSKKLKVDVVKGFKKIKESIGLDEKKYSKCYHCTGLIPLEALLCPTCGDMVKITTSTEFRIIDDYRLHEVCTLLATRIIEVAYAIPSSRVTTATLINEYIKIYRGLKDELEKAVVKYFKCPQCSKLIPTDSTVCQFCEKEVKFISSS